MQKMKFYFTTSYALFLLIVAVFSVMIGLTALSFAFHSHFSTRFILAAIHLGETGRLFLIFLTLGVLFALLLTSAWSMHCLVSFFNTLIYSMRKTTSKNESDYSLQKTVFNDANEVIDAFNAISTHLKAMQNKCNRQLVFKDNEMERVNRYIETFTYELGGAKIAANSISQSQLEFIKNMYHELRTPLNAIIGYSEILQEGAEKDGLIAYHADLGKMIVSAKHLLMLIDRVLEVSGMSLQTVMVASERLA